MSDLAAPRLASRTAASTAPARGASAITSALTMSGRCVRLSRRNADAMIMALMLPIMLMLLFVYLFGGAIHTGTAYVTYVVPGVLLLCAGFGASSTAVSVTTDMTNGIIDRFRSMDIGGPTILTGHVVASVVRNMASTVVVLGVAFLIGFRPHADALHWLAAVSVLLVFILAISALSAAAGLLARTPEAANGFTFFIMFLPYASSAFVPIDTMPSWLHGFAAHQPITPVIETMRGLLLGTPVGTNPWQALAWCGGILVVATLVSGTFFRRRTA